MSFPKFIYNRRIVESDLDTLGHVNNASYLMIFEEARWDFITENGYGLKEVKESSISPIILKVEITYRKELFNREKIQVESYVEERIGDLQIKLIQNIYKEDGRLSASSYFMMSTFNLQKRKLVPPPPAFLQAMGISAT